MIFLSPIYCCHPLHYQPLPPHHRHPHHHVFTFLHPGVAFITEASSKIDKLEQSALDLESWLESMIRNEGNLEEEGSAHASHLLTICAHFVHTSYIHFYRHFPHTLNQCQPILCLKQLLSSQLLNTLYPLLTHLINTPYQHTFSTHLLNTPYQHSQIVKHRRCCRCL